MIGTNEGIKVHQVSKCFLCGEEGNLLYQNLRDRLFNAPGVWSLMRCSKCGLSWLNPQPIPEDIGKLYTSYFTHDINIPKPKFISLRRFVENSLLATRFGYHELASTFFHKLSGQIFSLIGQVREKVELGIMCLKGQNRGKLLDIGCGTGIFLAKMRELGWEVVGVEPDSEAVKVARNYFGLNVYQGRLEEQNFQENNFDAITMNHVIEHLHDPISTLKECYRILKPSGRLVITTLNTLSLGALLFNEAWRGWEVPRHFYIFTPDTLKICVERAGFKIIQVRTTARSARFIWSASKLIRRNGFLPGGLPKKQSFLLRIEGLTFWTVEYLMCCYFKNIGEEIVLVATK